VTLMGVATAVRHRPPKQGPSVAPALNRPGESGDFIPWKGWGHVSDYIEEVSGRAA
jgi:hypothetical protein